MRVLLVEVESNLAEALRRALAAEGFTADLADNAVDGLRLATAGHYDVIVLDVILPQRNAYLVCEELRAHNVSAPVLMLTTKAGEHDEAERLDASADDYLSKPFSFQVVRARSHALAGRGPAPHQAPLTAGDITINPSTRSVVRAGVPVTLTAREYDLLVILTRRAGIAVSKRELLDAVWGTDFHRDANLVEVYVGYLRRKLDKPFGRNSVQTVRGVGYQLVADA